MSADDPGTLYVVGTPIGNLDDLSVRARDVLAAADLIAAEDTRRTRGLLSSIGLKGALIAYHEHNEERQTPRLIERLLAGDSVALVSDAGMPTISDPGLRLVRAARVENLAVVSVPGPDAAVTALSVAGLATDRFVFEGFLPRRGAARRARLEELATEPRTLVFYEAVHRVAETLEAFEAQFGSDRPAAIARELTKLHESVYTGSLAELRRRLADEDIPVRGEFVLLVAGRGGQVKPDETEARRVYSILSAELPAKAAVALTAQITGLSRNAVYRLTRVPD